MRFKIYYRKEPSFMPDPAITRELILNPEVFACLGTITEDNLEKVFIHMQGEVWSPNGEARELILSLGLHHTSMSVGDAAVDEDGKAWECDTVGWREVKPHETRRKRPPARRQRQA